MLKRLLAAFAALLISTIVHADNSTTVGSYVIHHNVITTDNLSPPVASAYGIQRSKERAMLNVSVIRGEPGKLGESVPAEVDAVARNLIGQQRDIPLREIREGNAIYYIGDFPVANREKLDIFLTVTPVGEPSPLHAQLRQEFYTD